MALSSYYLNYGEVDFSTSELMMNPSSTSFKQEHPFEFAAPTQLQTHCYSNLDNFFFDPSTYQNYPTDCFLPQEAQNPLLDSFITLEDYELNNRFLKRQKCYNGDDNYYYYCNNNDVMSNYYYMESPLLHGYAPEPSPLMVPPPNQCIQESSCSVVSNGCTKRESSVTAQSVAARQRRKKISEKTVELSKLVPGGSSKMNSTAEMLHSAFKYVKFMQAQVGILQAMSSFQEVDGFAESGPKVEGIIGEKNLHEIVTSGKIQDKLSSMEKCLVPINFVKELAKDESFNSVSESIKKLLVSPPKV